jgi:7,8-dihydro-6-hydroxymethylpterin-pyrophosphokinase
MGGDQSGSKPSPVIRSARSALAARYANGAALVKTRLDPDELLDQLKAIEALRPPRRGQRWTARGCSISTSCCGAAGHGRRPA